MPAQVLVDVVGADAVRLAVLVQVLQQVLAGQFQAAPQHPRQARMLQADVVLDAALALEAEPDATAVHVHVPGTQGGQAVGAVVAGVAVVADADQGGVEQRNRQGHHLVATEAGQAQLGVDVPAQPRQRLAEAQQALVLVGIAYLAPARVVAVLLAPTGVAAGGLEMAVGVGTDPDLAIGRRNGQLVQPADLLGVADALAVGIEIDEALALPASTDARLAVVDVAEAGGQGGDIRWRCAHAWVPKESLPV